MYKSIRISLLAAFFIIYSQITLGQTQKEKAYEKGIAAIELMDNGKFEESIQLLKEAQKIDPKDINYPYEIAYAYYAMKDYKKAIKYLEGILDHEDVNDLVFQLLGNAYDNIGKSEKAMEIYQTGLKLFPNSGNLYLEMGVVQLGKEEYNKALEYFEKGIDAEPEFPSNYYWAAKLFCNSTEEVWGLIYGEIFMNLERNSRRTAEISKLLYDTYKSEITLKNDSASIDFCNIIMNADDIIDTEKIKFPFCMVFGQAMLLAIIDIKNIDINSLDTIRTRFLENYYKMEYEKTHPNSLFAYLDKIHKAGHFEAYNHWILMKGDEDAFVKWQKENKGKWDNFVKWFTDNELIMNNINKFNRHQY